jgi:hypothetical protein
MSESYQVLVLISDGISAEKAIYTIHEMLGTQGGILDENSLLMLNETNDTEPEPEYITDSDQALATLATWSTFGSIAYSMPEFVITVSYQGSSDENLIQAVKISIMERAFERLNQEAQGKYLEITQSLHQSLHAKRTIMDWGIEYKGFNWREEVERLRDNRFVADYNLADFRDMTDSVRTPIQAL